MRTHVDIDDSLLEQARALGGHTTIKSVVNVALAEYVKQLKRQELIKLRGQLHWQGDLGKSRKLREPNVG
jgi:Arc/MetJ family transcription regulator